MQRAVWLTLLTAVALGLSPGAQAAAGSGTGPSHYQVVPWSAGKTAPAFIVTDLNGKTWRLQDLRGRAVLINFWATWCEPCRAEMPSLQALADQNVGKLVVLAVNLKESEPTITRFVQRTGLSLPVVRDADGATARAWGVSIYPSTVLIDARGRVRSVVRGEVDWLGTDAWAMVAPLIQ